MKWRERETDSKKIRMGFPVKFSKPKHALLFALKLYFRGFTVIHLLLPGKWAWVYLSQAWLCRAVNSLQIISSPRSLRRHFALTLLGGKEFIRVEVLKWYNNDNLCSFAICVWIWQVKAGTTLKFNKQVPEPWFSKCGLGTHWFMIYVQVVS